VSDEPSNTASEFLRYPFAFLTEAASPPSEEWVRSGLTDDFAYEDRRHGVSYPDFDAETYPKYVLSIWQTGAGGQPRFEHKTLAVRGERFAAVAVQTDFGNGFLVEYISVVGVDATLNKMQRHVDFDRDNVDGAFAELDRLDSQPGISN
jgi:hypothetical protein